MERIIITLATAGIGGFIGLKLKIPAGALIGSMIAVAVFNILVGKGEIPINFKIVAQIVVGGMIGLNYTMDTVKEMKSLIVPAVILVVGLFLYSVILGYIIHRVSGLDLVTALFSSAPGGLADMTIISEAYGAVTPKVAALHLVRLVTVITLLPLIISSFSKAVIK